MSGGGVFTSNQKNGNLKFFTRKALEKLTFWIENKENPFFSQFDEPESLVREGFHYLKKDHQFLLFARYGESLKELYPWNSNEESCIKAHYFVIKELKKILIEIRLETNGLIELINNNPTILLEDWKSYVFALPKKMREVVLYKNGESLKENHPFYRETIAYNRINYLKAVERIEAMAFHKEQKRKLRKERNVEQPTLEIVPPLLKMLDCTLEEAKEAILLLQPEEQEIINIKYGKNLDGFFPFPTNLPFQKRCEDAICHLKEILRKLKKSHVETQETISIPQVLETQNLTNKELKEKLLEENRRFRKAKYFTSYQTIYGGILPSVILEKIIEFAVASNKDDEYYEKRSIEVNLFLYFSEQCRQEQQYSESISKKLEEIFVKKMKAIFPLLSIEEIVTVLQITLYSYDGKRTYEEEIRIQLEKKILRT